MRCAIRPSPLHSVAAIFQQWLNPAMTTTIPDNDAGTVNTSRKRGCSLSPWYACATSLWK